MRQQGLLDNYKQFIILRKRKQTETLNVFQVLECMPAGSCTPLERPANLGARKPLLFTSL